jgi:uncharacterized protein with NRDE domain
MCLIAIAWKTHPRFRLALIANRDEFHARPTRPAQAHADAPDVFGGRDLEKGGSWLLASQSGRIAAVTNVRAGVMPEAALLSRGELTDSFVKSRVGIAEFLEQLSARAGDYGRFNLVLGTADELHYASNHPQFRHFPIEPGMHALSNGDFDAPWPKAENATQALSNWLVSRLSMSEPPEFSALFAALADSTTAPDDMLPDTGVGIALERYLSSAFIVGKEYGTRASTVLLVDADQAWLGERRYAADGIPAGEDLIRFAVNADT